MQTALVTGITGQDGAYLAKNLLDKGYKVNGAFRRTSARNFWRIKELGLLEHENLTLHEHDVTDIASTVRLLQKTRPDEIYNLAAQSFVGVSFDQPTTTAEITGLGALNLLEAVRMVSPESKFYQASTSEMFGLVQQIPQNEDTPFYPRSPYGVAKLFAHWTTVNYRESYGLFAASGILFNHESPLRGKEFVTRKVSSTVARILMGSNEILELGNLGAERDWGFAEEYVEGMWGLLQIEKPETVVLATNRTTTVREFVKMSFAAAGFDVFFSGENEKEVGVDVKTGKTLVSVNPIFYRPAEVELLLGDYAKAEDLLGWAPKTKVEQLAQMMVEADVDRQKAGRFED